MLALSFVAACGDTEPDSGGSAEEGGDPAAEVVMELVAFTPDELEVDAGATVTWRNRDVGAHTVTAGTVEQEAAGVTPEPDGTFDSGELAKGDAFEQTFDEPGTYTYFCALHPATMRGEIRVT